MLLDEMHTFRRNKGVCEKKDARDESSLADLCPTHTVVS
jgi:hypothetical protein